MSLCDKCLGCNKLEYANLKLNECKAFKDGARYEHNGNTGIKYNQATIREFRNTRD